MKKVLFAAAEALPFISTGGLADVVGSLPAALVQKGVDARVVIPLYGTMNEKFRSQLTLLKEIEVQLSWRKQYCGIYTAQHNGVTFYFIDNEFYFKRSALYGSFDDGERFAFFSKCVLDIMPHIDFFPDVLHANDWQTALSVIYLRCNYGHIQEYQKIRTVYSIHNIAYQGIYNLGTMGDIFGLNGVRDAYETGRGRVVVRAKTDVEVSNSGRETIVVSEIPYMVNKQELIEKIAALVEDKKIDGIAYVNDESDHKGMRIVIKLKMGAVANVVLNTLFKLTPLQSSFSINNVVLVDGRPKTLNLRDLIKYFVKHRHEVVVRRAQYELEQAQKRAHILEGLLKALDFIDEVIAIIRASATPQDAKESLMSRFDLSEIQSNAIVEMRLRQLTGLERAKLQNEYDELMKQIAELTEFLASVELQMNKIKEELQELKSKYGDPRRSQIELSADDFNPEDFYPNEDVVITISHLGYIKRTPLADYKLQNRGGVGAKGSTTREEDFIEHIYVANMHSTMLFFTQNGKCFWLKVYEIPEGAKASKGRAIQNVINIEPDDKVCAYINVPNLTDEEYINNNYIVLATKKGIIKKTSLEAYSRPRTNGVNAITIREGDMLLEAALTDGNSEILIAARNGKCVRFHEEDARAIGRTATGVRGISIEDDDEVVGMITVEANEEARALNHVLVVSENGFGKRSEIEEYRLTSRGGKGVKTINITEKTGSLVAVKKVTDENDLMIINKSGVTIRVSVSDIRLAGRATQGVKLISLREGDSIAAVCSVNKSEEKLAENTEEL